MFCLFFTVIIDQIQSNIKCLSGIFLHVSCCISSLFHCKSRFFKETGFQDHKLLILFADFIFLVITDCKTGKFYKQIREWQPYQCCRDIKHAVSDRDRCRCRHLCHKRKMNSSIDHIEQNHEYHGSDQIEIQMDHRCTFCILIRSNCGQKCCHTSTNILSHDDRKCRTERYCASHTKCLQNTYGCRR